MLEKLALVLNVPAPYFMKTTLSKEASPIFFRSLASATKSLRMQCEVRLEWLRDIADALQEWVNLPTVNLPALEARSFRDLTFEDVEKAADACRKHWKLGSGPISDVILVLENAGAVVAFDEVGSNSLDGLSMWSGEAARPFVILAGDKGTCVRSRFDAAHELGHLVLHRSVDALAFADNHKLIEAQAHRFASAFLMPAERFAEELVVPSLDGFLSLKRRWRASVAAMIMRSYDLQIIDEFEKMRLFKMRSARGWVRQEPLDDELPLEQPRLLSRAVKLVVEQAGVPASALAEAIRLSNSDIESLAGLPMGYLSGALAEIIQLPQVQLKTASGTEGSTGTIVPFRTK